MIRITKEGTLQIQRAGKWKDQFCKDTAVLREMPEHDLPPVRVEMRRCGDWCPQFFEGEKGSCACSGMYFWKTEDIKEDLREGGND